MVDIESLRKLNRPEHIAITEHARQRLIERGISVNDIRPLAKIKTER